MVGAMPTGTSCDTAGRSVLLVDDEADIRYIARLQLGDESGFHVVGEACDGFEAIDLAVSLQPAVILLDAMMPRMDGYAALPELLQASPHAMVVMLSAMDAGTHEPRALSAGAFAYLEKDAIVSGFADLLRQLHDRFRRALDGHTVWVPERPRP